MEAQAKRDKQPDYLIAIRENDRLQIKALYLEVLPSITNLVQQNNGTEEDAKDVLQDGLMVLFEKVQQKDFQLTSSIKTYLYSTCRFIWLRKLKKNQRMLFTNEAGEGLIEDKDVEEVLIREERQALFKLHLEKLSNECRSVLKYFFKGIKLKEIANQMGYTEQTAKSKKYTCQKSLVKNIQQDKRYAELL